MKELDSFTVERLEDLINQYEHDGYNDVSDEEVIKLVCIALAAKRADPIDEVSYDMSRGIIALINETNIGGTCQLQAKIQCFIENTLNNVDTEVNIKDLIQENVDYLKFLDVYYNKIVPQRMADRDRKKDEYTFSSHESSLDYAKLKSFEKMEKFINDCVNESLNHRLKIIERLRKILD